METLEHPAQSSYSTQVMSHSKGTLVGPGMILQLPGYPKVRLCRRYLPKPWGESSAGKMTPISYFQSNFPL